MIHIALSFIPFLAMFIQFARKPKITFNLSKGYGRIIVSLHFQSNMVLIVEYNFNHVQNRLVFNNQSFIMPQQGTGLAFIVGGYSYSMGQNYIVS